MRNFREFTQGIFFVALAAFFVALIVGGHSAYKDVSGMLQAESEKRIALMEKVEEDASKLQTLISEVGLYVTSFGMEEEGVLSYSDAAEIQVKAIENLDEAGFNRITVLLKAFQDSVNR